MSRSLQLAWYLARNGRGDRTDATEGPEAERAGFARVPRPTGPLVWVHSGKDTDARAASELAGRMISERDDLNFLFTTAADTRLETSEGITRILAPDDNLIAVRRFLDHWTPNVGIWTEPELRPALIADAADRDIPLYLFDADTAKPDAQAWRWSRGMSGSLLERFSKVITGSKDVATTLQLMGLPGARLEVSGFLQEGTPAPRCDEYERDRLAALIGARPVWLAADVTRAERDAALAAHLFAQRKAHRLMLIIVPKAAGDGAAWQTDLQAMGLNVARRSLDEDPGAETQVYLADADDEMGLWFRLAPISFLGRSISTGGGISPHGAAAMGSAILFGPNVGGHAAAYAKYESGGAARRVRNAEELGRAVEDILSPATAAKMAHAAWNISSTGAEVTDRAIDLILTELDHI